MTVLAHINSNCTTSAATRHTPYPCPIMTSTLALQNTHCRAQAHAPACDAHCERRNKYNRGSVPCGVWLCYTEKAEQAQQQPGTKTTINPAQVNRKKQCGPNETKPNSNAIHPRKRQNSPTNNHTPSRIKSTHTHRTYTGMRPHAPGQQAGDHPVPVHTERYNPPKVWTQR